MFEAKVYFLEIGIDERSLKEVKTRLPALY